MDTKFLLAVLVAAVISFFGGWLVWGMLLGGYMEADMTEAAKALQKPEEEMSMGLMVVANILWGLSVVWVVSRTGSNNLTRGAVTGGILVFLIALTMDLFFYTMMNMYSGLGIVAVDVIANAAMGAVMGACAGWVLGYGQSATG